MVVDANLVKGIELGFAAGSIFGMVMTLLLCWIHWPKESHRSGDGGGK